MEAIWSAHMSNPAPLPSEKKVFSDDNTNLHTLGKKLPVQNIRGRDSKPEGRRTIFATKRRPFVADSCQSFKCSKGDFNRPNITQQLKKLSWQIWQRLQPSSRCELAAVRESVASRIAIGSNLESAQRVDFFATIVISSISLCHFWMIFASKNVQSGSSDFRCSRWRKWVRRRNKKC